VFKGFSEIHPIPSGNRFGQRNAHFGFACRDNIGAGTLEGVGVSKMSAARQNAQAWAEEAGLSDDLSRILDVGAEDEAAGRRDACLVERSGPQSIPIDRRKSFCS
jgi:hypothetical protein